MPVPEKSEGHFAFHRPRASPHPQQTLNTTKARRHNYDVPQRQQALLVSQVLAISAGLRDSPIHMKFPLETWALPHAEGESSSCSPDNACWPLTQGAPKNPLQSGFSSKQEYGPDLPHPLPKASEQPTCPLQAISRAPESGKHLLLLKYWANRCDQQAAAGHCLDLPWLKVSTNQTLQDPSHKLIFSALWSPSTPSNST